MDNAQTATLQNEKVKPTSTLANRGIILIVSSNFLSKSFIISASNTIIGRNSDCDITINDPLISNIHCKVSIDEDGKFFIEDMDSKNHTFLNGKIIRRKKHIIFGDRIVIGDTILRFYLEEKIECKRK